jgi:signal transduction histidine kinase
VTTEASAERPARRSSPALSPDLLLAIGVGALQVAGTALAGHGHRQAGRDSLDLLAVALLAAGPAALVVRRRWPVPVLGVAFAATLAYAVTDYARGPIFLALIVAYVTAVIEGHRAAAWLTIVAGYASFLWLPHLAGVEGPPSWRGAIGLAAWLLVLTAVGEVIRVRRERAAERERTREEEARRMAGEERLRIARELHDVLAHNVSLINVQAGVALHLIEERPEQARTALAAIKQASGETLRELRSVLGALRSVDEDAPLSPAPGLARLDELVARTSAAGPAVRQEVDGEPRPLPRGVDLAAFRIAQEALTNVARHAGPATATVRLTYGERELTVEVEDDGRGAPGGRSPGGGNGLPGMRERALALGGELTAGPRPGGGFRVEARLPLDGEA